MALKIRTLLDIRVAAASILAERVPLDQALAAIKYEIIHAALQASHRNRTEAARRLGVHRNTIHNFLRTYRA